MCLPVHVSLGSKTVKKVLAIKPILFVNRDNSVHHFQTEQNTALEGFMVPSEENFKVFFYHKSNARI